MAGSYLRSDEGVEPLDGLAVAYDPVHSIHIEHDLSQGYRRNREGSVTGGQGDPQGELHGDP